MRRVVSKNDEDRKRCKKKQECIFRAGPVFSFFAFKVLAVYTDSVEGGFVNVR